MKSRKFKVGFFTILLFVASCASNPYKNVTVVFGPVMDDRITLVSAFKDLSKGKLYKAKVEVLKNYLSGLLMIKEVKGSKRVIFTSETGLKFFDFEFAPDTFIVHYVLEQLDNKHVLNTLREDIGTVVFHGVENAAIVQVKIKGEDALVHRTKDKEDWMYYYYQDERLNKIERASDKKKKVIITFENYEEDIPQLINIVHKDFKMNIELTYIKR
ncbi:MAG: hypothetical protein JKY53_09605 [Flavobacteriales bacterium]|nr:hypothetical protein [Flavobacteriales bacterium]